MSSDSLKVRTLPGGYRAGNTQALLVLMYEGATIEHHNGVFSHPVDYCPRSEDDTAPWVAVGRPTARFYASELRATPDQGDCAPRTSR